MLRRSLLLHCFLSPWRRLAPAGTRTVEHPTETTARSAGANHPRAWPDTTLRTQRASGGPPAGPPCPPSGGVTRTGGICALSLANAGTLLFDSCRCIPLAFIRRDGLHQLHIPRGDGL